MQEIKVKCPAKINLFFNIIGIDERNYHLVHGLNQSISLYDYIHIKTDNTNTIEITCSDPNIPTDKKNSVYKAAKIFLDYTKISTGLKINIEKNIPTEAGLGGESTDAAGTIKALDTIFNTNLTKKELNLLGYKTSCDVPFCIEGGSKEVKGCGEILTPWSNPYQYYLVITPPYGHSTKEMFSLYDKQTPNYEILTPKIGHNDFHKILDKNILELINKVKETAYTSMLTGSGSSVIGIYQTKAERDKAYEYFINKLDNIYKINKAESVNGIEIL